MLYNPMTEQELARIMEMLDKLAKRISALAEKVAIIEARMPRRGGRH